METIVNSPHNFPKVNWINLLSSFSELAEKAALKKATKQKKTEEEKDLSVLMWIGLQRPRIRVLVTKKNYSLLQELKLDNFPA